MSKKSAKDLKFEEGLERLEEMLTSLEKGELSLEESIKTFKEGASIFLKLQKKIDKADGEIKTILNKFNQKQEIKDYTPEKN